MAILKRPMFRKGGSANSGIMDGLDRGHYANGGTIGGGMIHGNPMGYRTGFEDPSLEDIISGKKAQQGTQFTEDYIQSMYDKFVQRLENPQFYSGVGWQVPYSPSIKEQSLMELIKTQPDKSYEMFKTGELDGVDYATKQKEQAKDLTKAGVEFDKEIFGYTPEKKEIIPPGEVGGPGYVAPKIKSEIEKTTGDIDDISVSDLNKERMKLFAPHMQKRMMADAWGAASEEFGESTGDWKQDVARALGAAGKAMGGTRDLADKISMLTLQGEIAKDIKAAEKVKPSNFESAVSAWRNIKDEKGDPKYSLEEALEKASGKPTESSRFYEIQEKFGKGEAIADQQKDNPQFWGSYSKMDKKELKKLPDEAIGKMIYDETENSFYAITLDDDGNKQKEFLKRA
jgi:hypothetical protein